MMDFFGEDLLLTTPAAVALYREVRDLPIIDCHCHLDEKMIRDDAHFSDLGELWLASDHYKWRAMRLCGVDEYYITGGASYHEKYLKYAEIFPLLAGNPLYYWTELELKMIFGITDPLSPETAESIYERANRILRKLSVRDLLEQFRVRYIATTDDPVSPLSAHGSFGELTVAPTFRPDRFLSLDGEAIRELGEVTDLPVATLADLKKALVCRLDRFRAHGCRISDHGMDFLPQEDPGEIRADLLYLKKENLSVSEKRELSAHLLAFLAGEYASRGMVMQLHFATYRGVNTAMRESVGRDTGFDIMRGEVNTDLLVSFFDRLSRRGALPKTVVYSLNPACLPALATLTGAFPGVRLGAAWWFNDTVSGIREQIMTAAEYAVLGTNLGMLTDSRSFASYVRFDFYRRILADTVGGLVERGEYDLAAAKILMRRVCYDNVKEYLGL